METKVCRIALFGNVGSGKSSIRNKIEDGTFNQEYTPTIGIEFGVHNLQKKGFNIKQQMWDTPGEERFGPLLSNYFFNNHAFIFVVDGTMSLNDVNTQLEMIKLAKANSPAAKFYIAISKCDIPLHDDFYDREEAEKSLRTTFLECGITKEDLAEEAIVFCSAKEGNDISELFEKIGSDFVDGLKLEQPKTEIITPTGGTDYIEKKSSLSLFTKVLLGGNALIAAAGVTLFVLAVFTIGSFLTFGILPSAFAGAAIITASAFIVWNAACAIYHFASDKPPSSNTFNTSYQPDDSSVTADSTTELSSKNQNKKEKTIKTDPSPLTQPTQHKNSSSSSSSGGENAIITDENVYSSDDDDDKDSSLKPKK